MLSNQKEHVTGLRECTYEESVTGASEELG